MGKGDKKTRRGKLFMGSYGVTRPNKSSKKIQKENKIQENKKKKTKKPSKKQL